MFQVVCDLNNVVSTPEAANKSQVQRDKVLAVTTLWGLLNDTKKRDLPVFSWETCKMR